MSFVQQSSTKSSNSSTAAWGSEPLGSPLELFLIQVVLILATCRILAWILRKIRQPAVIAELTAGILLGPSVFGHIPGYLDLIFPESSLPLLSVVAETGLIFFMFLIGIELELKLLKRELKTSLIMGAAGIVVPVLFSIPVSLILYKALSLSINKFNFVLFLALAMSLTAFPVLARIVKEKGLFHTRLGFITLSTAALEDVAGWVLLAAVLPVVAGSKWTDAIYTVLSLIGFVAFMFFPAKWGFAKLVKRQHGEELSSMAFAVVIGATLLSAWLTEYIGLHAVFGPFVLGLILPKDNIATGTGLARKIEDLILSVFLPIYFAMSGLRTELGLLTSVKAWMLALLVTAAAVLSKVSGGAAAGRLLGMTWRESFTFGVLMNTKGLIELIVLNIGLEAGVITPIVFSIMVLMALSTTFISSPIVGWIYPLSRIREFEAQEPGKKTLILALRNRETIPNVVSVLDAIVSPQPRKFRVFALHVERIEDRPSTYMPHLREDGVLTLANDCANLVNLKLRNVLMEASDDIMKMDQIASAVQNLTARYTFAVWPRHELYEYSHLGGDTIGFLSAHVSTALVVLIPTLQHSVTTPKRIAFVFSDSQHDFAAASLVRAMSRKQGSCIVAVRIEHTNAAPDDSLESDNPILSYLQSAGSRKTIFSHDISEPDPTECTLRVLALLNRDQIDLLVLGCSPQLWSSSGSESSPSLHYRELVRDMTCPTLVVWKTSPATTETVDASNYHHSLNEMRQSMEASRHGSLAVVMDSPERLTTATTGPTESKVQLQPFAPADAGDVSLELPMEDHAAGSTSFKIELQ